MLVPLAAFAAGFPLAFAVERLILGFSRAPIPMRPADQERRTLPWQTARWRLLVARALGLSLPLLLAVAVLRFEEPRIYIAAVAVVALVICCATDLLAYRVPNLVTLPALAAVLALGAIAGSDALLEALAASLMGGGLFLVVALLTRGGLGGGDVKLVLLIGAALGLPEAVFAMAAGILAGSVAVIGLYAAGAIRREDVFPFAPFLSAAAIAFLLT